MSQIKVAINGFGRIGRLTFRALLERENINVVAINDLTDTATLAQLLKWDSTQGKFPGTISGEEGKLIVDGKEIAVLSEKDPSNLPWKDHDVDVVLESTGIFTNREKASLHLQAGAKKVVLSAPAKGGDIKTIVLGVNGNDLTKDLDIISNASCTTNCLAPIAKILDDSFGIESGYITTVHAYTADQRIQDAPHKDWRRARAAAINIVPTSTGAAKAVGLVLPHLQGKLDGIAVRVPTPTGSLTDLVAHVKKEVSADEVNAAVKAAAESTMSGIVQYSEDELVSTDIIHNPYSSIFDSKLTSANGKLVKVVSWYDNEWGYSNRTADVIEHMSSFF